MRPMLLRLPLVRRRFRAMPRRRASPQRLLPSRAAPRRGPRRPPVTQTRLLQMQRRPPLQMTLPCLRPLPSTRRFARIAAAGSPRPMSRRSAPQPQRLRRSRRLLLRGTSGRKLPQPPIPLRVRHPWKTIAPAVPAALQPTVRSVRRESAGPRLTRPRPRPPEQLRTPPRLGKLPLPAPRRRLPMPARRPRMSARPKAPMLRMPPRRARRRVESATKARIAHTPSETTAPLTSETTSATIDATVSRIAKHAVTATRPSSQASRAKTLRP